MDWEAWLRGAAKRPSDHEADKRDRTERQIRAALNAHDGLRGRPWRVYVKGSYANNTNVRLNYDVDIAVEYYGYFYSELAFELKGSPESSVGLVDSSDTYSQDQFKADILEALEDAYGSSAVEAGNIAYRVRQNKTTLPADVVPCWEYRRYDGRYADGSPVVHIGSRVFPSTGGYKDNFPEIQKRRGTDKNSPGRTNRRYKRMVRCLKKMQTKLVADGVLDEEIVPSYAVECVVFNVPDLCFGNATYLEDFKKVIIHVWGATKNYESCKDWEEVHGLKYMFRGGNWSHQDVHRLVDKAWDAVGVSV